MSIFNAKYENTNCTKIEFIRLALRYTRGKTTDDVLAVECVR